MSTRLFENRSSNRMAFPRIYSWPGYRLGALFLAGYVLLDWISFIHPFGDFGITPWNPPPGLSFILILLFGQRFLPLLFVAPLLADLLVRQLPVSWSVELLGMLVIGGGYSIALLFLLRPASRFNPSLTSMRDLLILMAVAGLAGACVAASYVGLLIGFGYLPPAAFLPASLQYWIGDLIGVLVVTPFGLVMLTRGRLAGVTIEALAQMAAILVALAVVFLQGQTGQIQFFYLLFLPIIWMAVRGGLEAVTIGILMSQLGLIVGIHFLPFSQIDVTAFQALMMVLTITGLIAGMLVTGNRRTEIQLRLHQDSLSRIGQLGSMGQLAAAVAHEINQPLMAAGTYARITADLLDGDVPTPAQAAETAGKAVDQIQRAAEVVRRLRALIRLDQSGQAPCSVARIVRETLTLSQPDLARAGITAQVDVPDGLPQVMADLLQIEQVLLNLVRNSIDAIASKSADGGTIRLGAIRAGAGHVEFSIRDDGPGFPAEILSGPPAPLLASSKPDGLGLGLSLCRSIVESHGGQMLLESGADGAIVRFTIPVAR